MEHIIKFDVRDPTTYAAKILLKSHLHSLQKRASLITAPCRKLNKRQKVLRAVLKKRGELVCEYCGKQHLKTFPDHEPDLYLATIDHVIPKCKNGKNNRDNIKVVCWECNQAKKHSLLIDFFLNLKPKYALLTP